MKAFRITGWVVVLVAVLVSPVGATPTLGNPAWHWPGQGVRTIHVLDAIEPTLVGKADVKAWRHERAFVLGMWALSGAVHFTVTEGPGNGDCQKSSDGKVDTGYLKLCWSQQTETGSSGWAYLHPVNDGTGHIDAAVAAFKQVCGPTDASCWPHYPFQWLLCHEVGHTLGLGHRNEPGDVTYPWKSCMWGGELPDAYDLEQVRANYAHDDPAMAGGGSAGP